MSSHQTQTLTAENSTTQNLYKMIVFILFWTIVLGPFEYFVLHLPIGSVVLIRIFAVVSNILWLKLWFQKDFWGSDLSFLKRMLRMVSTKLFVNGTNFTVLFLVSMVAMSVWHLDTGLHFTLWGLVKKTLFITGFAILLTGPYEWLIKKLGFESNAPEDVGLTSDI